MSYTHCRVADIFSEVKPAATSALEAFLVELQKEMPNLKFAYRRSYEVHAYMDGCPYTLGILGFDTSDSRYYVTARFIENKKYSDGKWQRYTLWSKDRKVAIRNAKTFLRPYTTNEVAEAGGDTARIAINDQHQKLTQRAQSFRQTVANPSRVLPELRVLIEGGYKFADPDFDKDARAWVAAHDTVEAARNVVRNFTFVHVTNDWMGQVLKMQRLATSGSSYIYKFLADPKAPSETVPIGEADEAIVGRISVLSMVGRNTYVEGVGYRATEDMFYVET